MGSRTNKYKFNRQNKNIEKEKKNTNMSQTLGDLVVNVEKAVFNFKVQT